MRHVFPKKMKIKNFEKILTAYIADARCGPGVRIHNEASLILNSAVLAIMEVLSRGVRDIIVKPHEIFCVREPAI